MGFHTKMQLIFRSANGFWGHGFAEIYKPQTVSAWMKRRQSAGLVLVGKWEG